MQHWADSNSFRRMALKPWACGALPCVCVSLRGATVTVDLCCLCVAAVWCLCVCLLFGGWHGVSSWPLYIVSFRCLSRLSAAARTASNYIWLLEQIRGLNFLPPLHPYTKELKFTPSPTSIATIVNGFDLHVIRNSIHRVSAHVLSLHLIRRGQLCFILPGHMAHSV